MTVNAPSIAVIIIAAMRTSKGIEYDVATNEVIAAASKRNVVNKNCLASLSISINLPWLYFAVLYQGAKSLCAIHPKCTLFHPKCNKPCVNTKKPAQAKGQRGV